MSRFDQAKMLLQVKKIQKELQKLVITVEQGDGAVEHRYAQLAAHAAPAGIPVLQCPGADPAEARDGLDDRGGQQ